MKNSVMRGLVPLLVGTFSVAFVIAGIVFVSKLTGSSDRADICSKPDEPLAEYAMSKELKLDYPALAAVIDSGQSTVIVGGQSSRIELFSLADEEKYEPIDTSVSGFSALALNEKAGYLVGGTLEGDTVIWKQDLDSRIGWEASYEVLPGRHGGIVTSVAISDDGKLIGASGKDTISVWRRDNASNSWQQEEVIAGHSGNDVRAIAFGGPQNFMISSGNDRSVKVWQLNEGQNNAKSLFSISTESAVNSIAVQADNIILGQGDGAVKSWSQNSWQMPAEEMQSYSGEHDSQPVKSLSLSATGNPLVSGGNDSAVKIWNLCSNSVAQTLPAQHSDWINAVDISSEGEYVISAGQDQQVIIWQQQSN